MLNKDKQLTIKYYGIIWSLRSAAADEPVRSFLFRRWSDRARLSSRSSSTTSSTEPDPEERLHSEKRFEIR